MNNELIQRLTNIISFTYNLQWNDVKNTIECANIQYRENVVSKEKKENDDNDLGLSMIIKEKIDVDEHFDDGIIFCDDIFDISNDDKKVDCDYIDLNCKSTSTSTSTSCLIDNNKNIIDFFENKTNSITQDKLNSYADEMSEFMECYTPNYGMFDVDKDIIVFGWNNMDLFGPNNGSYKKEDMKVVLDDIQKWMKIENEDRYVIHVLACLSGNNSIVITMIDSYGESFYHSGTPGCIPRREWHKGIVNYQPCRGHLASRVKKEYGGLSKYKFTDTMIDTVKGFYSDKSYEWGYIVQNSDVSHQDWIYETLHCKTLERMREVAKKEFEKYEKYKRLYYKMNIQKAKEKKLDEEKIEKDKEMYAELVKKYGQNIEKKLL